MNKYLAFSAACIALAGCSSMSNPVPATGLGLAAAPSEVIEIQFLPVEVVAAREVTVVSAEPNFFADADNSYCEERRVAGSRIVQQDCYVVAGEAGEELQRQFVRTEIESALDDERRRIMQTAMGGQDAIDASAIRRAR